MAEPLIINGNPADLYRRFIVAWQESASEEEVAERLLVSVVKVKELWATCRANGVTTLKVMPPTIDEARTRLHFFWQDMRALANRT